MAWRGFAEIDLCARRVHRERERPKDRKTESPKEEGKEEEKGREGRFHFITWCSESISTTAVAQPSRPRPPSGRVDREAALEKLADVPLRDPTPEPFSVQLLVVSV